MNTQEYPQTLKWWYHSAFEKLKRSLRVSGLFNFQLTTGSRGDVSWHTVTINIYLGLANIPALLIASILSDISYQPFQPMALTLWKIQSKCIHTQLEQFLYRRVPQLQYN